MRRYLFMLLMAMCATNIYTQVQEQPSKATSVLDKASAKIKQSGNVKVEFTATQFRGTTEVSSTSGTMLLQEKKLQCETSDMTTWFDGNTLWNYIPSTNEVNISNPTKREMAAINPYTFLGIYKKGFRSTMKESELRGQSTYEVHLVARYRAIEAQEIYVDVRKSDYVPLCIRIRQGSDWFRIALNSFSGGQHFTDSEFTFHAENYPGVTLVDLR